MKKQSYSNHKRFNPLFHGVLFAMVLTTFVLSAINLIQNIQTDFLFESGIIMMMSIIIVLFFFFIRFFGVRLQDRVIRAEENFRHYQLTGKPLDHRLRMQQIIALRFSPDEEFPELCEKAIQEHLLGEEIKKTVSKWKGDYHRI